MYGNNYMLDSLTKRKDELENMIKMYQTPQIASKDFIEWRILNENEEVDNLYVQAKTLFINDKKMVLKGVDGSLEKWDIKKTYPIDKKDERINELENEIKKLKEMINNEHSKSIESNEQLNESTSTDDVNVDTESKESVRKSKEETN